MLGCPAFLKNHELRESGAVEFKPKTQSVNFRPGTMVSAVASAVCGSVSRCCCIVDSCLDEFKHVYPRAVHLSTYHLLPVEVDP